jgi:hypothetical protein
MTPTALTGTTNPPGFALITNADPTKNRLYVTTTGAGNTGQLWVINTNALFVDNSGIIDQTSGGTAADPFPILANPPTAIAAKGNRLYITFSIGALAIYQINSDTSITSLGTFTPGPGTPAGIAIRPASGSIISDRLYITGNQSAGGTNDNVYVIAIVPAL